MSLLELTEALVGHAMILTHFSPRAFLYYTLEYSEQFSDMI